jgi:hypothetical protein
MTGDNATSMCYKSILVLDPPFELLAIMLIDFQKGLTGADRHHEKDQKQRRTMIEIKRKLS